MGDAPAMIQLQDLAKRYPDGTSAVHDLSLEVPLGEVTMLVGPSGCGKTTTLKMINRLIEPTSGRIILDGTDVTHADPVKLRRNIGYVIQNVGLFPHRTIAQNIATVPGLVGWNKKRTRGAGDRAAGARRARSRRRSPSGTQVSCPAGSVNASAWPVRWPSTRRSC